jgi:hypothetical protein
MVTAAVLPWVRTEFIIFAPLVLLMMDKPRRSPLCFVMLFLALAGFLLANRLAGNYGYVTIFNFVLLPDLGDRNPYPAEMQLSTDVSEYLHAYVAGAWKLLTSVRAAVYLAGGILAAITLRTHPHHFWAKAASVTLAFAAIHFLVFPEPLARYYYTTTLVCCLLVLELSDSKLRRIRWSRREGGRSGPPRSHSSDPQPPSPGSPVDTEQGGHEVLITDVNQIAVLVQTARVP